MDDTKIKYRPYPYRLNPMTVERLKLKKTEVGKSYNVLFTELLDLHDAQHKKRKQV